MAVLQDKHAIIQVLGGIMYNPKVILNNNYDLKPDDFPEMFHKLVFSAMNNIVRCGAQTLDIATVDSYLKNSPKSHKVFTDNKGMEWMAKAVMHHKPENFDYNYQTVKKYSLLRDLKERMGLDISDIYNENELDLAKLEAQMERFNSMTVESIIEHYNRKWMKFKEAWNMAWFDVDMFQAGDGIGTLKDRLKQRPERGYPMANKVISEIVRGQRKKKFYLVSAPSGKGKTRYQIANACNICIKEYFDIDKNEWVEKPHNPQGVTYISTELTKEEVQQIALACVSGVDEDKIVNGTYNEEEEERVDKAIELLEKANFNCIHIPDFDITDIENIISDEVIDKIGEDGKIIRKASGYVFFDYLHTTPKIMSYYSKKTGNPLAEHQVLYLFGNALKNLANKYDVFMYTSTQVNREYKNNKDGEMDATVLRGAMSLADKTDVSIIITEPTQKELTLLKDVIEDNFDAKPNTCYSIFKNRGNKWKNIKVWTKMNLGTMRETVLFVTDYDYKEVNIPEDNTVYLG